MDASLPNIIKNAWGKHIKFDFIIDDGAHYPEANRLTFENCYPFLKKNGTYKCYVTKNKLFVWSSF